MHLFLRGPPGVVYLVPLAVARFEQLLDSISEIIERDHVSAALHKPEFCLRFLFRKAVVRPDRVQFPLRKFDFELMHPFAVRGTAVRLVRGKSRMFW